jgi:hypothetical protein
MKIMASTLVFVLFVCFGSSFAKNYGLKGMLWTAQGHLEMILEKPNNRGYFALNEVARFA